MNKVQAALELRKALQMFLQTYCATVDMDTEMDKVMSVASVFPKYKVGMAYKTKEVFSYGTNRFVCTCNSSFASG